MIVRLFSACHGEQRRWGDQQSGPRDRSQPWPVFRQQQRQQQQQRGGWQ